MPEEERTSMPKEKRIPMPQKNSHAKEDTKIPPTEKKRRIPMQGTEESQNSPYCPAPDRISTPEKKRRIHMQEKDEEISYA